MGRRKMKGGGYAELADPNFKNSAYKQMDNKLFLNFIFCISLMGFIWFFVSTFLVRHMYSEVLCYSLMLASIIFSLLLLISVGVDSLLRFPERTVGQGVGVHVLPSPLQFS